MVEVKKKRTLEDFFAAPLNPPDNYVIDPNRKSEVVKEMEEEERINRNRGSDTKISVKTDGTPVVDSAPLDVSGYASPKKASKPVPQELPEIPDAPKAPPSVSSTIRSSLSETPMQKAAPSQAAQAVEKDSGFPWDRALIGATPFLVGLLTGNKMEGAEVAGNHLAKDEGDIYKRERDLAGKLTELKLKQSQGIGEGKRRYTAQTIASNAGTNGKAAFDTFTGKYLDPQGRDILSNFIRSGYAVNPEEFDRRKVVSSDFRRSDADYLSENTRLDPTTGELGIVRNGRITQVGGQETGTLNVKQQGEAKGLRDEFRSNPIVKRTMPVLSSANQIMQLLNSGKAVSQAAAKTALARMSGEVGNLSEMEQAIYTRSPSIQSKIRGWLNLQATDEALQPHEVEDLKQIASFYSQASKELLGSAIAETQAIAREDYNLPNNTVSRITSPIEVPLMEQARKGEISGKKMSVTYNGKTHTSSNPKLRLAVEVDGKVQWTDEPWEKVKAAYPKAKRLN